jgi:hypothetical protein
MSNSGEDVQVDDSGDVLKGFGWRRGYDEMQGIEAISIVWSASSIASCREGGGRLEQCRRRWSFGWHCRAWSLRGKIKERVREMRRREKKGVGGRRGGEVHCRRRIWPVMPADASKSNEGFLWLGDVSAEREEKGRGRSSGAIYSRPISCMRG